MTFDALMIPTLMLHPFKAKGKGKHSREMLVANDFK